MTIFSDAWSGADNDSLIGRTGWTKYGSGVNGAVVLNGAGGVKCDDSDDCPLFGQTHGSADHFVELVVPTGGLAGLNDPNEWDLVIRASDRNSKVWATWNQAEGVWEFRASGAGRFATVSSSQAAGDVMRFQAVDDDYALYQNNSLILTQTEPGLAEAAQTNCGIVINTWTGAAINPVAGAYRTGLVSDLTAGGGSGAIIVNAISALLMMFV